MYETDLIDQEMFSGRIKELNDEMEKFILRRNEIEATLQGGVSEELSFDHVKQVLTNLNAMIHNMASDEKKVFYQLIIEEVVVKDKKVQEIKLKIDEQVQEDTMKQSLSDGKSDRDIFVRKNSNHTIKIII